MRALQMATIDPATFLGLDEELGGIAPGRARDAQRPARDRRVAARARLVDGEVVARDGALDRRAARDRRGRAGPGSSRPDPSLFAPLTGIQPVARYESAVINRRVDREVPPGDVQAALVGRDGSWITKGVSRTSWTTRRLRDHGDDVARAARARHGPGARWRAPRPGSPSMGGGFAFDGGWSAPLEIDGLITAGGFDTAR